MIIKILIGLVISGIIILLVAAVLTYVLRLQQLRKWRDEADLTTVRGIALKDRCNAEIERLEKFKPWRRVWQSDPNR